MVHPNVFAFPPESDEEEHDEEHDDYYLKVKHR